MYVYIYIYIYMYVSISQTAGDLRGPSRPDAHACAE